MSDVSEDKTCPVCGGSGVTGGGIDGDMPCWACEGTGTERPVPPEAPADDE